MEKSLEQHQVDVSLEESKEAVVDWKPSLREILIMVSLALLSLMVSLDATIVVTSISVSCNP